MLCTYWVKVAAKEIGDYEGEKYLCRYSQLKFLYLCKF
jgi:hypothetical protein